VWIVGVLLRRRRDKGLGEERRLELKALRS